MADVRQLWFCHNQLSINCAKLSCKSNLNLKDSSMSFYCNRLSLHYIHTYIWKYCKTVELDISGYIQEKCIWKKVDWQIKIYTATVTQWFWGGYTQAGGNEFIFISLFASGRQILSTLYLRLVITWLLLNPCHWYTLLWMYKYTAT